MNIQKKLEKMEHFSNSEKELANYILQNKEAVLFMSVHELADATYTSTSSVVRLCRKIGLDGFRDFKIQFVAELQKSDAEFGQLVDPNFPFQKTDSFYEISEKMYNLSMAALHDTYAKFSIRDFEKAVNLITKSRKTAMFAIGDNFIEALSFQNKMEKINKHIYFSTIPGESNMLAYNLTKEDCAILISYSGESELLKRTFTILKEHAIPIICITARPDSTFGVGSNIILENTSTESQSIKFATFASGLGTSFILNTLYSYFFVSEYDKNSNKRVQSEVYFLDVRKKAS